MWLKRCGINNPFHHRTDLLPIFKYVPQYVYEVELDIFFQVSQKSCNMPEWCGRPRAYNWICAGFSNILWFKYVAYLAFLMHLQRKHALFILGVPIKAGLASEANELSSPSLSILPGVALLTWHPTVEE